MATRTGFWFEWILQAHRALFFPLYYYVGLESHPVDVEEQVRRCVCIEVTDERGPPQRWPDPSCSFPHDEDPIEMAKREGRCAFGYHTPECDAK